MKTLVVKVPDALAAEIEAEARSKGMTKSDVVRRRLERRDDDQKPPTLYELGSDLIGNLNDETRPTDISLRKKYYLKKMGYGTRRHR